MKRKRFNHFGDAIIGMLTGYQVISNFKYFKMYGHGEYVLDLLKGSFTLNGKEIDIFPIFANIQKWFNNEISKLRIDIRYLSEAMVTLRVAEPDPIETFRIETRSCIFFKKIIEYHQHKYRTRIILSLITDEKDYSKKANGVICN